MFFTQSVSPPLHIQIYIHLKMLELNTAEDFYLAIFILFNACTSCLPFLLTILALCFF